MQKDNAIFLKISIHNTSANTDKVYNQPTDSTWYKNYK